MQPKSPPNPGRRKFLTYTTSFLGIIGAFFTAIPFVSAFKPSAKAEAAGAPVKVDLSKLLPGEMMTVEWRGRPVFVVNIPKENTNFITKNLERLADPNMEDPSQPDYAKNDIRSRKEGIAVLTGDTLFLGDVGRPDLSHFRKENSYTKFELAEMLFKSLRDKIMPLNDDIIIYPGHGAGSACGKNMMNITYDTLKNQKKVNYALRSNMTQSEFINEVTFGLEKPPEYFPMNVEMNQYGYKDLNDVIKNSMKLLNPKEFDQIAKMENTIILDVRHQNDFVKGHIPGSIFIGLNGSFAPWVGSLIKNVNTQILIVSPKNKEHETILRLSRVGFDNVVGFLKGGLKSWNKRINYIESLDVEDIIKEKNKNLFIDVRAKNEFDNDHIDEFVNLPLTDLETNINKFKNSREKIHINCAGGYRSVIAISILKKYGIHNTIDIKGGYAALKNSNFSLN